MSKALKVILSILAVAAIAAGVSYAVYRYLENKKSQKPLGMFKSQFNEDGTVDAIDITDEILGSEEAPAPEAPVAEEAPAPAPAKCDDAVCAVDMCMPY